MRITYAQHFVLLFLMLLILFVLFHFIYYFSPLRFYFTSYVIFSLFCRFL